MGLIKISSCKVGKHYNLVHKNSETYIGKYIRQDSRIHGAGKPLTPIYVFEKMRFEDNHPPEIMRELDLQYLQKLK